MGTAPRDELLLTGQIISHYRVLQQLGEGGMGVVYKAEDTRLGRSVALKFLPGRLTQDETARLRFKHEAQAASALDHENICTVYDIGETRHGGTFIAMAFYEGETLKDRIARGPLAIEEAVNIAVQMTEGLSSAHSRGIIHRDIKPANVILTTEGVVKIVDFGIAKLSGRTEVTRSGATVGTTAYMAPEQVRGEEVDHRVDIWAVGAVLYELLTGRQAFAADYQQAALYRILHEEPEDVSILRSDTPSQVVQVLARCLAKDRDLRFSSADELLASLSEDHRPDARIYPVLWRRAARSIAASPRRYLMAAFVSAAFLLLWFWMSPVGAESNLAAHLAILPFESAEADREFGEGLQFALANSATRIGRTAASQLLVVPSSELRDVRSAKAARERFGVDRVVTGTFRSDEDRFHVRLILTDAVRLIQLDSREIVVPRTQARSLERQIMVALAGMLQVTLDENELQKIALGGTTIDRAYELYLKGRSSLLRYEAPENVDTAIRLLQLALGEDSTYALAHAALAEAYLQKYRITRDPVWVTRADESCRRALEQETDLAPVYVTMGRLRDVTGEHEAALRDFTLAIALDSSNASAHAGLARVHRAMGHVVDSEVGFLKAIALEPTNWSHHNNLGSLYLNVGRFEDAIGPFETVKRLAPDNHWGFSNLGAAYLGLNRLTEARDEFENVIRLRPTKAAYSNLGYIRYVEGRYADEAEMYERALMLDSSDYRIWGNLAGALQRVGREDSSLAAYNRAVELCAARLEINPNNADALADLAHYQQALGDNAGSRNSMLRALKIDDGNLRLLKSGVVLLERIGAREDALKILQAGAMRGLSSLDFQEEPDLEQLRRDPRFVQLFAEATR